MRSQHSNVCLILAILLIAGFFCLKLNEFRKFLDNQQDSPEHYGMGPPPPKLERKSTDNSESFKQQPAPNLTDVSEKQGYVFDPTSLAQQALPFQFNLTDVSEKQGYVFGPTSPAQQALPFQYKPSGSPYSVCRKRMGRGEEGHMGYKAFQKIHVDEMSTTSKVLCMVLTDSTRHEVVRAIVETYGSKCDGFLAASDQTDFTIGAIDMSGEGEESRVSLLRRLRTLLRHVYDHYRDQYDFFHLGPDNMYVVVENLKRVVSTFDSSQPLLLGSGQVELPTGKNFYCAWSGGLTMNRKALEMIPDLYHQYARLNKPRSYEIGKVLSNAFENAGVKCVDPIDENNSSRYHMMDIDRHAHYTLLHWKAKEQSRFPFLAKHGIPFKEKLESISTSSVTFYLSTDEVPSVFPDGGIRRYHAILYGLCENRTHELETVESPEKLAGTHPHAGALDADGEKGYIHDPEFLRNNPLNFTQMASVCRPLVGQGEEGKDGMQGLQKIRIHSTSLHQQKKVLCSIYTHSNRHDAVRAIAETWGARCDGFLAASNLTDRTIGAVNLLHDGPEEYGNMWNKVKSIWAYIYDHYLDEFDFFYVCGDDTYVVADNLRYAVATLSDTPDGIAYVGGAMADFPAARKRLCGGGAGYVLSRAAVQLLVRELYPLRACWPNHTAPDEDRIIASCFRAIGLHCMDNVDENDEPRFHPLDVDYHVRWKRGARSVVRMVDLEKYHGVKVKEGLQSISSSSVSFHLTPKYVRSNSTDRGIRRYHALLYGLCK